MRRFKAALIFVASSGLVLCCIGQQQASPAADASTKTPVASEHANPQEIVPGLAIPSSGIVWIVYKANEKSEMLRIFHKMATFNRHSGENFARALTWQKGVVTLDLSGVGAKARLDSAPQMILFRKSIEEDKESNANANGKSVPVHYVLLRVHIDGDHRVVCFFSYARLSGKATRSEDDVDTLVEEIDSGQWVKITSKQPLPDGEYAVVRMPDDKTLVENFVYDFGVGPAAKQPTEK